MAAFSFGAGNARKILRIPLSLAGRLVTALVPRSRDAWVFGCAVGIADGALALWRVAAEHGERATWLVSNDRQARDAAAAGIPFVRASSPRGFWLTVRARVIVVTHGFGDVNRYGVDGGAVVVQLWHGIPLKRIGLDSPETLRSAILPNARFVRSALRRLYAATTRQIRVLPAASELVRGRLESAFGLKDARVPVTGEPRVDVLSRGTADERRRAARADLDALTGGLGAARLVLYAPTWRDGAPDPAVPAPSEWSRIVDLLERLDAVLLVRSHPLGAGDYRPSVATDSVATDRVRGLGSDVAADVTPLLPALDVLVTDYSSLAFDAALVPLPVVFFAPDLDAYRARRGMYGRYADVATDGWATDWAGTLDRVADALRNPEPGRRRSFALSEQVHAHRDGGNARRVYRAVRAARERARGDT